MPTIDPASIPCLQWHSSLYSFSLTLPLEAILDCSGPGAADDAVAYWAERIDFSSVPPQRVRGELAEYGAWTEEQLSDDDGNRRRLLWLACCSMKEEIRADLRSELGAYSEELAAMDPADIADDDGNPSGSVRLQIVDLGWKLWTGEACYDDDARGWWASAEVEPGMHVSDLTEIADALLSEASG